MKFFCYSVLLAAGILLAGCAPQPAGADSAAMPEQSPAQSIDTSTENPFESDADTDEVVVFEYGHGIPIENPQLEYRGEMMEIPYNFLGGGVDSTIGVMLFLNGTPQPLAIKGESEEMQYLKEVNIPANAVLEKTLLYEPQGVAGDEGTLTFVCLSNPWYQVASAQEPFPPYYHLLSLSRPYAVRLHQNSGGQPYRGLLKESGHYQAVEGALDMQIFDVYLELDQFAYTPGDGMAACTLRGTADADRDLRITFWVNNEPVKILSQGTPYAFCDVTIKAGQQIEMPVMLDLQAQAAQEPSTLYAIGMPVESGQTDAVYKTETKIVELGQRTGDEA